MALSHDGSSLSRLGSRTSRKTLKDSRVRYSRHDATKRRSGSSVGSTVTGRSSHGSSGFSNSSSESFSSNASYVSTDSGASLYSRLSITRLSRQYSRFLSRLSSVGVVSIESSMDTSLINNQVNLLKMEENQRQKIRKILSGTDYQRITFKLVSSTVFQYTIVGCVVFNIFLLIMPATFETFKRIEYITQCIDAIFLAVYTTEAMLKIYVLRSEYFKDYWELLDFAIVIFSMIDSGFGIAHSFAVESSAPGKATTTVLQSTKQFKVIRLLRALRMLRILRTLKFVSRMKRYMETILNSSRQLGPIFILTMSIMITSSSIACSAFSDIAPLRFGNMILSFFTLFQIITLDDWGTIVNDLNKDQAQFNIPFFIFMVSYTFTMSYVIWNLLLAVFIHNFEIANDEYLVQQENDREREEEHWERVFAENLETEDSDETFYKKERDEVMAKLRGKYCDPIEDLRNFYKGESDEQVIIAEWYYRLFPAIERQHFIFSNQVKTLTNVTEDALAESEDMFIVS